MLKILVQILLSLFLVYPLQAQQIVGIKDATIVTSPTTNIVITGGISFSGNSNLKDSGDIYIKSNPVAGRESWLDSVNGGVFDLNARGTAHFASTQLQDIYGPGNFYNLRVVSDSGINVLQDMNVLHNLLLDTGMVYFANANSITVSDPSINAIQSSSNYTKSYVLGKLARATNTAAIEYFFPIGKIPGDSLYAPIKIERQSTSPISYTAEYIPQTPPDQYNFSDPYMQFINNTEYWQITNDGTGSEDDAWLSLSWRPYSNVSPVAAIRDSLFVAHYEAKPEWVPEMNMPVLTTVAGNANFGYVRSGKVVTDFGAAVPDFTLGQMIPLLGLLPIKLVEFKAIKAAEKNLLQWKINTNEDAAEFEIFRSTDARSFYSIGKLQAKQKNGIGNYELPDLQPAPGWNYYKLKIVSKDSKVSYSAIEKLYSERNDAVIKLYPNPAHSFITVSLSNDASYNLYLTDASGRTIAEQETTKAVVRLNISSLLPGVYYIRVMTGNKAQTLPFIKL